MWHSRAVVQRQGKFFPSTPKEEEKKKSTQT
jgi:hypothetical protein